jgi:glycosyltransferase involved in cell wall biosynthesis
MKISGFTYVRNGFAFGYPFLASIQSLLPIVDELIVVVGDSTDGTREAIAAIDDRRVTILDSVWDEESRSSGKIFAQQANIGIAHAAGDWAIHLQVDEVLHESAAGEIRACIERADGAGAVDGLLFPFYHFWGDFDHIRNTRRTHQYEIRAFKNDGHVFSYRDSQGFRKYASFGAYQSGAAGNKLKVYDTGIPVFHYSYCRNPELMKRKSNYFHKFWHDDAWLAKNTDDTDYDYNHVDKLERFAGEHPVYMQDTIRGKDWDFTYDPSRSTMRLKDRVLTRLDTLFGRRLFAYRNYIKVPMNT